MTSSVLSSFDPFISLTFCKFSLMLLFMPLALMKMLTLRYWVSMPNSHILVMKMNSTLMKEMKPTNMLKMKGAPHFLASSFVLILCMNLMGMLPYAFPVTGHLYLSMTMALFMWSMIPASSLAHNLKKTMEHFYPSSTHAVLAMFVFVLEILSMVIRPIALGVRMAVNITAGHCFMALMSQMVISMLLTSALATVIAIFLYSLYFVMEVGVAIIQTYILITLLSLWSNEHA